MTVGDGDARDGWIPSNGAVEYKPGEVHVWRFDLSAAGARSERFCAWLSADERARAARFAFERDRDHFVVARAGLRHLLATALARGAGEIAFALNRYGKPRLAGGGSLRFNVSHSGDRALYAIALDREVGVDVEAVRPEVARQGEVTPSFAPGEIADLARLSGDEHVAAFFALWSRKEAYIKGRGLGLSLALDRFRVSLLADDARLLEDADDLDAPRRWALLPLAVGPGYAGAVAADGPFTLRQWELVVAEPAGGGG